MTDLPTHCFPGAWWKAERGPRGTASSCSVSSRLCQDRKRAVAAASRWTGGFPHSSGIAAGSRLFIATFWIEIIWIISRYGFPDPSMKTQWQIFSPSPCYLQFQCTNTRLQGQRLTRSTVRAQLNPHSLPGSKGSACLRPEDLRAPGLPATGNTWMWHRSVPLRRDGVAEPGRFLEPRVRLRLPRIPRELSRQHRPGPAPPSTPANREPQLRDQRRGDLEAFDSFLRTGRCRALLPGIQR